VIFASLAVIAHTGFAVKIHLTKHTLLKSTRKWIRTRVYARSRNATPRICHRFRHSQSAAEEERSLSGEPATPINANQIESRGYI